MTPKHAAKRTLFAGTIATLAIAFVPTAWLAYAYRQSEAVASAAPTSLPQVVVSKPLASEVDSRLGFLGQFSAVEHVELRAQVGGTLTEIHFKDGDIVHKGGLLFTIDPRPYEIRLTQANAQLETAIARLALADRELTALRLYNAPLQERHRTSTSARQTSGPRRLLSTMPTHKFVTLSSISSIALSRRRSPGRSALISSLSAT